MNVLIVRECETARPEELARKLERRIRRMVEYSKAEAEDRAIAAEDPPRHRS